MNVSEIMSKNLVMTDPESTVGEAATLMGENKVGSVAICQDGKLVGILTERDIVRALSTAHDAPMRPVVEWMTKDPATVDPDTTVREALRTMVDGGFRHLPIVENGSPVGIISIRDVASSMTD